MAPSAKTTPVTKTKKKRFGSAKRKRLKAVRAELATDPDYSASTADLSSVTGIFAACILHAIKHAPACVFL